MKVECRWETALTERDHAALAELLRAVFVEAPDEFQGLRSWGWARKEARLWLADGDRPVAHLAVERRLVSVGGTELLAACVGDVGVSPATRGRGLGATLMKELRSRLSTDFAADFGVLLCGEGVVDFYRRTGWSRVANAVRHVDPHDERTVREVTSPIMVMPARRPLAHWPEGLVDLRGLPC